MAQNVEKQTPPGWKKGVCVVPPPDRGAFQRGFPGRGAFQGAFRGALRGAFQVAFRGRGAFQSAFRVAFRGRGAFEGAFRDAFPGRVHLGVHSRVHSGVHSRVHSGLHFKVQCRAHSGAASLEGVHSRVHSGVHSGLHSGVHSGLHSGLHSDRSACGFPGRGAFQGAFRGAFQGAFRGAFQGAFRGGCIQGAFGAASLQGVHFRVHSGVHSGVHFGVHSWVHSGVHSGVHFEMHSRARVRSGCIPECIPGLVCIPGCIPGRVSLEGVHSGVHFAGWLFLHSGCTAGAFRPHSGWLPWKGACLYAFGVIPVCMHSRCSAECMRIPWKGCGRVHCLVRSSCSRGVDPGVLRRIPVCVPRIPDPTVDRSPFWAVGPASAMQSVLVWAVLGFRVWVEHTSKPTSVHHTPLWKSLHNSRQSARALWEHTSQLTLKFTLKCKITGFHAAQCFLCAILVTLAITRHSTRKDDRENIFSEDLIRDQKTRTVFGFEKQNISVEKFTQKILSFSHLSLSLVLGFSGNTTVNMQS